MSFARDLEPMYSRDHFFAKTYGAHGACLQIIRPPPQNHGLIIIIFPLVLAIIWGYHYTSFSGTVKNIRLLVTMFIILFYPNHIRYTVGGRNLAPPWMVETPIASGMFTTYQLVQVSSIQYQHSMIGLPHHFFQSPQGVGALRPGAPRGWHVARVE